MGVALPDAAGARDAEPPGEAAAERLPEEEQRDAVAVRLRDAARAVHRPVPDRRDAPVRLPAVAADPWDARQEQRPERRPSRPARLAQAGYGSRRKRVKLQQMKA